MVDKPKVFKEKSGGLLVISNKLVVFLLGRLAVEHPFNTTSDDPEIALAQVISNSPKSDINKVKCLYWPENQKIFFDTYGLIKRKISFHNIDTTTAIGILQKILLHYLIKTYRDPKKPKNLKCINENHFGMFAIDCNGKCTTCGLPEIVVYLLIGVEIKRRLRNTLKHATEDALNRFCSGTHRFDDFPLCANEQDIYNENMRALQYILNFLADDTYFPKLKEIPIEISVEYKFRMNQIITDTDVIKILDLRTPDPLPVIEIYVENQRRCLFEDTMEKRSLTIQHVPDGFLVYFDNSDVNEILLFQKKLSDKNDWEDIQPEMEQIEMYKRFLLLGEESDSHIDIRMITTRISKNDDQPYLIFTAVNQKVHDDEALRHVTLDRSFSKIQVHCHSFGVAVTAHTLLKKPSFRSLKMNYQVNLKVSGDYETYDLINKNYLQRYYGDVKSISFPITHRASHPQNDFEQVFQLIEDALQQFATSDDHVIIIRQVDFYNILKVLDVEHREFDIQKTDVSKNLIIFMSMIHTVLLIKVTDQTTVVDINEELKDVCNDVKSFLVLIRNFISQHTLSVKGMLATTNLNKNKLHQLLRCEDCKERDMHLTKEDLTCDNILRKFRHIVTDFEGRQERLGEAFERERKWFFTISDLVAACMACRILDLPRLVGTDHQMIQSIQLTHEQLEIIHSPENHKIIRGPFGSGKTILAKELVRIQSEVCETDDGVLYFVSMDAYTLFQSHMEEFCKSLNSTKLVCTNIREISEESGSHEILNLPQTLKYLSTKHEQEPVNVILEEYDSEVLYEEQAEEVKNLLRENFLDRKVTLIVQSIEKERKTKENQPELTHKSHCFEQTGMRIFILSKTLRYSVSINDSVACSQSKISQHNSFGRIPMIFESEQSPPNKPKESTSSILKSSRKPETTTSADVEPTPKASVMTDHNIQMTNKSFVQTKPDKLLKTTQKTNKYATLESSYRFFDQKPGHKIIGKKPCVVRLDPNHEDSSKALCYFLSRICFPSRQEKGLIICNTKRYYNCITNSLKICELQYLEYMIATEMLPCLSKTEKMHLYQKWINSRAILLTDSAGCRGLEEKKVVLVVDESEHHERHLFVESACRSTSELYIVSFKCREVGNQETNFMMRVFMNILRYFKFYDKEDQVAKGRLAEVVEELVETRLMEDLTESCFLKSSGCKYESFEILNCLSTEALPDQNKMEDVLRRYLSQIKLTEEEALHTWTFNELYGLIRNNQFEKLNAILLLPRQLTKKQMSGKYNTLLHGASDHHAPIQTLQLLCQKGCGLRDRDASNDLPIHYTARASNVKAVEWMVREDILILNEKGFSDYTPLHLAANKNNKETIQVLLSHGADVNAINIFGRKADELSGVNDEIKKMIREYRRW